VTHVCVCVCVWLFEKIENGIENCYGDGTRQTNDIRSAEIQGLFFI